MPILNCSSTFETSQNNPHIVGVGVSEHLGYYCCRSDSTLGLYILGVDNPFRFGLFSPLSVALGCISWPLLEVQLLAT